LNEDRGGVKRRALTVAKVSKSACAIVHVLQVVVDCRPAATRTQTHENAQYLQGAGKPESGGSGAAYVHIPRENKDSGTCTEGE
jgi:hypothetical protein